MTQTEENIASNEAWRTTESLMERILKDDDCIRDDDVALMKRQHEEFPQLFWMHFGIVFIRMEDNLSFHADSTTERMTLAGRLVINYLEGEKLPTMYGYGRMSRASKLALYSMFFSTIPK